MNSVVVALGLRVSEWNAVGLLFFHARGFAMLVDLSLKVSVSELLPTEKGFTCTASRVWRSGGFRA